MNSGHSTLLYCLLVASRIRKIINTVRAFLGTPQGKVFVVGLVLVLANLAVTHRIRPYNSDDVSWQTTLLHWRPFEGSTVYFGSDPFILKVPIYLLLSMVFSPGRQLLFLTSALFAVINFTLFYFSALYLLRKFRVRINYLTLMPFVWLASLGYYFAQLFLNPNVRNAELGVMFAFYALVLKVYLKEWDLTGTPWRRAAGILIAVAVGLFIYNDLYFLYFGVAPMVLFLAYLWLRRPEARRQTVVIGLGLVISFLGAKAASMLTDAAGIHTIVSADTAFIGFEKLLPNMFDTLRSLQIVFQADFWGRAVLKLTTFSLLCNAAILGSTIYIFHSSLRRKLAGNRNILSGHLLVNYLGLLFFAALAIYLFSTVSVNTETYRYLVILPMIAAIGLAYTISALPQSQAAVLTLLLFTASMLNLVFFALERKALSARVAPNRANSENFLVINEIKKRGLTKGYAEFWDANINTYLSKGEITFLPTVCAGIEPVNFRWLVAEKEIVKPAERTFYLADPQYYDVQGSCKPDNVAARFGEPAERFKVNNKLVYVYNRDILAAETPQTY